MAKEILIVDDSVIGRRMVKSSLPRGEGIKIHEAVNGLEGLNKFKEMKPDITFMDLTMPVMDGAQALEEIKKVDKDAIVVVITADVQPKSIAKVLELGAYKVIKKPPSKEEVKQVLLTADKEINNGG